MVKTSLNIESEQEFEDLQNEFLMEATICGDLYDEAKNTTKHLDYGFILNKMTDKVEKVLARGNPSEIFFMEMSCEQFYLEKYLTEDKEQQSSREVLKTLEHLQTVLQAPLNHEQYRADTAKTLGEKDMKRLKKAPPDDVRGFVRRQNQRLAKLVANRMLTPPEKAFFDTRRESLKIALKQHERNCQTALGFDNDKEAIER